MNDPIKVVIPATAEASSEYRIAQSQANVEREGLKRIGKTIFSRGKPLDPDYCFQEESLDSWSPLEPVTLRDLVDEHLAKKVDKAFSDKGLAATIAMTDTVAGVSEVIEYDENEQIVKPIVEHQHQWDMEGEAGEYWYQCACGAIKPWPEGGSSGNRE